MALFHAVHLNFAPDLRFGSPKVWSWSSSRMPAHILSLKVQKNDKTRSEWLRGDVANASRWLAS